MIGAYKKIASKLNATFSFTEQEIFVADNSSDTQLIFYIKVPHIGTTIEIRNHEGVLRMGDIEVDFTPTKPISNFKIRPINFIEKLFSKSATGYTIKGKDTAIFLNQNKALSNLLELNKTSPFNPVIIGSQGQTHFNILTEYNLNLEDNTLVIPLLVDFYKSILDQYAK
jgi:hypothetical protein